MDELQIDGFLVHGGAILGFVTTGLAAPTRLGAPSSMADFQRALLLLAESGSESGYWFKPRATHIKADSGLLHRLRSLLLLEERDLSWEFCEQRRLYAEFRRVCVLRKMNGWPVQLLSITCLTLAAKMEEILLPSFWDLQMVFVGHKVYKIQLGKVFKYNKLYDSKYEPYLMHDMLLVSALNALQRNSGSLSPAALNAVLSALNAL